ncbi:chemotaxis response regulator protein-glutamate methylesterase [Nocardioides sp. GY 10113]|uniref:protein-glutamate methylesterase/protein-glutamine glutaminase n=1 Tax=Nocardioides sp. GY 10113 TaxID=2569761 RepID=UPI0010A8412F|nr:chemotaxis response regulator protein-glutamate methylesterase [Nocardioides sp. GY 10113]TIC85962.1 chemotaxis response regulator protein-glutamate methylesterase [Nocardioides sp. GY 10113]
MTLQPTSEPIRVLVVDDSALIRRLVTGILEEEPGVTVVGTAPNGRIALERIAQLKPDVVTLDIEMPELDGIATVKELRRTDRATPVIMFSTLTERGAAATLDALVGGADDYVTKPSGVSSPAAAKDVVRDQLVSKVTALGGRRRTLARRLPAAAAAGAHPAAARTAPRPAPVAAGPGAVAPPSVTLRPSRPAGAPQLIVVGASTGGPAALTELLPQLAATFPVPIAIVQHMPPLFTRQFAERLDRISGLRVREAGDGEALLPGDVLVAPGDRHLQVVRDGSRLVTRFNDGPPENYCRPAVDVLFRSAAAALGRAVHGLVLTGMGSDGREGARAIVEAGGDVAVQDAATSVVWGMPGAVATAGLASAALPLSAVAAHLQERAHRRRLA